MACGQAVGQATSWQTGCDPAKGHVSIWRRVICYGAELMFGTMLALERASRLARLRAQGRGLLAN